MTRNTEQRFKAALVSILMLANLCAIGPVFALAENTLLGAPVDQGNHQDAVQLEKEQYTLGFSADRFQPYWVSWYVNHTSIGSTKRKNRFHKEKSSTITTALPSDYRKTLYAEQHPDWTLDRGHMCPSADRTKTAEDNYETFSMANMVPQVKELNRGPWKNLEEYCRDLVKDGNTLLITAGEYGGDEKINDKVVIPKHCWKIIVVMPDGVTKPSQLDEETRVIAVDMPNTPTIKGKDWTDFLCTVDDIEKNIDYDLLPKVPKKVQAAIESYVDGGDDDLY